MAVHMRTFFDLFSGIGGIRLGLERLGWTSLGYCELDRWALRTYRANFPCGGEFFWRNATTMPVEKVPDFDILCAGFPCQPWSAGGRKKGFADARGTLFFEIARLLEAKKPRAFLLENVKGLVMEPMLPSFRRMLQVLDGLGYAVFWKVLNSLDYGVPQNRERVFLVGFRHRGFLERAFPWPPGSSKRARLEDVLEPDPPKRYRLSERLVRSLTARMEKHGDGLLEREGWAGAIASSDSKIHARNLLVLDPTNLDQNSVISPSQVMKSLGTRWGLSVAVNATNPHDKTEERAYHKAEAVRTLKADRSGTNEPLILQLVGDRDDPSLSVKQRAFTINATPMSDRNQMVLQVKRYRADGRHEVREYDHSPTLTGQLGTGGHNVPLIVRPPSQEKSQVRMVREDVPGLKSGQLAGYDNFVSEGMTLRRLTPRECLRLQGFPESFKFAGNSDAQIYRQAGNTVTVSVVTAIAREMEKWLVG